MKCRAPNCENAAREDVGFCTHCTLAALARFKAESRAASRRDWAGIAVTAIVVLVLLPGGCGVMAGTFLLALRAVAGWP